MILELAKVKLLKALQIVKKVKLAKVKTLKALLKMRKEKQVEVILQLE